MRIFNFLASLCSWAGWFETRFDGNLEDRFSRDEAQFIWFFTVCQSIRLGVSVYKSFKRIVNWL